ncbi:MFS transporter [Macrococcus lamae]|uniref:Quinolone resistance protein NorB n=1 Tax=Macrococcus lamae TaxID=198484 RepID=A0A4R6BTK1_9STAP|nr:MFS transporter [Macrococcus lamae]TDM07949.1 MFS transporter [Macrococcus lamae]
MKTLPQKLDNRSGNLIILGVVLSILTYWLFAQTFLNLSNDLQNTFHTTQGVLNLAISLTSLITGIFMVASGNLSDRIGPAKMIFIGIILSIVGSLLVILTTNEYIMLTGRVIQGFSAASLMPSTISLFSLLFEGDKRRNALSWWSIGAFGGTGFASLFAGLISTYFDWQLVFIISIAFAVLGLILLIRLKNIELPKIDSSGRFDLIGLLLFTIVLAALSILITQGNTMGWLSIPALAMMAIVILGAIIFYIYEQKQTTPFIDFSLFGNKSYTGVVASNFLLNMSVGSIAVFNIFAQSNLGLSPFQSGIVTLPYVIFLLLLVKVGEQSIKKYGAKQALVMAPLLLAVGVALMSLTFLHGWTYIIVAAVGFVFFGAGVGLFATPALDTAISSLPKDKTGIASAIFKMASTLGQGFGIAILVSLFTIFKGQMGIEWGALTTFGINFVIVILAALFAKAFIPKKLYKDVS